MTKKLEMIQGYVGVTANRVVHNAVFALYFGKIHKSLGLPNGFMIGPQYYRKCLWRIYVRH